MVSRSVYEWDIRIRREARALSSAGHEITFLGLGSSAHKDGPIDVIGLDSDPRTTPRSPGKKRSAAYRSFRWLLLPEHRARVEREFADKVLEKAAGLGWRPDVVHAHDYPALVPAVEIAEMHQAALIYDSHEFWTGRPRRGRPEPFRRARTRRQEAILARRADAVIMVSDHGADLMERALGLDHVHVIRNTFPTRPERDLAQRPLGAVYAGRIAPWRDLETVFSASSWHSRDLALHLIGEVDNVVIPDWVQTHPMGTMEDVDSLLAEFGLGLVTMTNRVINHRIALPNKLFQAIAVGVPVIAANAPQTAEVVVEHDLGALYEPGVPASFDSAVEEVLDRYPILVEHVRRAQPKLDWAVDADRLLGLYRDLEEKRRDRVAP